MPTNVAVMLYRHYSFKVGGGDGDGDFGIVRQMDIARSFDRVGGAREIR